MKTKDLIAITAALALLATAAHAAVFTNNTTIAVGNTNYDGQDIVVTNCTLTVNGPHSFTSLLVMSNGVVTHTANPAGTTSNRLDLTILTDATVALGGAISVDGQGYGSDTGPGHGISANYGSGAGYGGRGGAGDNDGGLPYGSITAPVDLGSGGGAKPGGYAPGGAGGGAIRLTVSGTLLLNGRVTANGTGGRSGYSAGGGSGGSLFVSAGTLTGSGMISATGGGDVNAIAGGGGGGRIALYYDSNTFAGTVSAVGGLGGVNSGGGYSGGPGTIYTKPNSQAFGTLLIDGTGRTNAMETPVTSPEPFALVLSNATVYPNGALLLGSLLITTNATITHPVGGPQLQIAVLGDATIQAGAGMVADGRGYGSATGPGHGGSSASTYGGYGSGAGSGGRGGDSTQNAGGLPYGSITAPVDFGSGGGIGDYASGGAGGGAIRLTVSGTLLLNGRVTANGTSGAGNSGGAGGGGSGGSLFVSAGTLAGSGGISATGGTGGSIYGYAGGGGGGRIAIYSRTNEFIGANTAGNGTIYLGTNVAPMVIAQYPSGPVNRFVSYVDVTFNQPVDPATFTTDDLVLTAPSGPIPLSQTTLTGGGGVTWRIGFPTQFANGDYSIQLGPHIANLFGQEMTANYSGGFTVNFTTPTASASKTGGNLSLSWPSATGLSYQLQSATNLPTASWLNEGAPLNGTGGLLTNSLPIGVQPRKFYRFLLLEN